MRFETPKHNGWLIGDPHFGRDFRNGTPLHRRGEREAMQLAQFREELRLGETMNVMVGDLFDKPFVPLTAINDVAHSILGAAQERRDVQFVFLAGNHDRSRQIALQGAWELFQLAVGWMPNVHVFNEPGQIDDVAFFPWEWVGTAEQQLTYFEPTGDVAAVVGHWDTVDFGNRDHMVPAKALMAKLNPARIYTGHDHGEGETEVEGVPVFKTGSMQPYSHGEDAAGEMYVTLTADEALARADELKNMCVRILLEPGETMPDIDCLCLTKKLADREAEEIEIGEIGLGGFDIHAVLAGEFAENDVPPPVQDFIKERMGAFA